MGWCKYCSKNRQTVRGDDGFICCTSCGRVTDSDMFSSEVTFFKGAGGQSQMSGNFVRSVESDFSESRERTLMKGRDEISYLVTNLCVGGGNSIIDQASAFYRIAVDRNFTRGRRTLLVAASCLYIACRENKKAFLLIDFSEELGINVYVLGAVFLQLCKLLRLEEHPIVQKPVDPSLFIHRFTERLLGGKNVEVSRTALRILASMKRDWMQTGRKPSGLCGASLYISALSHGLRYSKSDITSVVHVCDATLTKRLIEFENTESGSLTVDEFNLKAEELEAQKLPNMGVKSSGTMELLCEHKGSEKSHFAHGLCKSCYDDFIELSGGLGGRSEPPAFQRAEKERTAKLLAEKKVKKSSLFDNKVEPSSKPKQNDKLNPQLSKNNVAGIEHQTVDEGASLNSHGHEDADKESAYESESLSDIDDVEVDGYLHNEDEKRLKKIIWEEMNKEYLEEQRLKKEAEDAAKEAYEASFQNCSGDLLAARELAAASAAAVAQSRKERQQKRAADAKNAPPAQSAAEATRQMLTKKRLSSKINYDVLEKLFDDVTEPDNAKKQHTEPESSDANGQQHEHEPERADEYGDRYGDDEDDDDLYQEEEYGYNEY